MTKYSLKTKTFFIKSIFLFLKTEFFDVLKIFRFWDKIWVKVFRYLRKIESCVLRWIFDVFKGFVPQKKPIFVVNK